MNNKTTQRFSWKAVGVTMLMLLVIVLTAAMAMPAFAEEATAPTDLGSHTFGATPTLDLDSLELPATATYSMTLNGEVIGTNVSLTEAKTYINAAMPVGNYILTATNGSDSYVRAYKVLARKFDVVAPTELAAVEDALRGTGETPNKFVHEWDGGLKLYSGTAVDTAIAALSTKLENTKPARVGAWENKKFDAYFSNEVVIKYNWQGMNSGAYVTVDELRGSSYAHPADAGRYTIYYSINAANYASTIDDQLSIQEYDTQRRAHAFVVEIHKSVKIPEVASVVYNGQNQFAVVAAHARYSVKDYNGYATVGTHKVTLVLTEPDFYYWEGKTVGQAECEVDFEITPATNYWTDLPDVSERWIEGGFDPEIDTFIGTPKFGLEVAFVITDLDGEEVFYDASQNIDRRAEMKAGLYKLTAFVAGTSNYSELPGEATIRVMTKDGMPWWITTCIVVGALALVAIIILILWKKGVFQLITGNLVIKMRTNATLDATIAAIRASKVAEESKASVAAAKAKDKADAFAKAAQEARERSAIEKAAMLEEKARARAEKAEQNRAKAEALQSRAAAVKPDDTDSDE